MPDVSPVRPRMTRPSGKTETIAVVDETDSEILRLLREDGRLSWRDLGAAVGLSANAAADRVRRLRKAGVIRGFVALIDPAAGGRNLEALVGITLAPAWTPTSSRSRRPSSEQVIEVLHLTGAPDYQLRVACKDTAELDTLLRTLRLRPRRCRHRDDDRAALGTPA